MNEEPPSYHLPEDFPKTDKDAVVVRSGDVGYARIGGGYQHMVQRYFDKIEIFNKKREEGTKVDPNKFILLINPVAAFIYDVGRTADEIIEYVLTHEENILFVHKDLDNVTYREKLEFYSKQLTPEGNDTGLFFTSVARDFYEKACEQMFNLRSNQSKYDHEDFIKEKKRLNSWREELTSYIEFDDECNIELMKHKIQELKKIAGKAIRPTVMGILDRLTEDYFVEYDTRAGDDMYELNDVGKQAQAISTFLKKDIFNIEDESESGKRLIESLDREYPEFGSSGEEWDTVEETKGFVSEDDESFGKIDEDIKLLYFVG